MFVPHAWSIEWKSSHILKIQIRELRWWSIQNISMRENGLKLDNWFDILIMRQWLWEFVQYKDTMEISSTPWDKTINTKSNYELDSASYHFSSPFWKSTSYERITTPSVFCSNLLSIKSPISTVFPIMKYEICHYNRLSIIKYEFWFYNYSLWFKQAKNTFDSWFQ